MQGFIRVQESIRLQEFIRVQGFIRVQESIRVQEFIRVQGFDWLPGERRKRPDRHRYSQEVRLAGLFFCAISR